MIIAQPFFISTCCVRVLALLLERIEKHWKEFISHLSKYERWYKEYLDDVYDGTHWKLKPEYEKIKINLFGSNAYPENFKDFIKSIQKFTGDKDCCKLF